ncbi:reverse transcriptase domain-containing protein [Tanacetum coccineum]
MYETNQMTIPFLSRLKGYYCEEKKGSYGPQFSKAYSEASHINNSIPRKEKDPGSFTLPCFINNVCFDNALDNLGAIASVMPLSTYLNLGLGELAHNKLTVELADRTMKYPKGIAENVLVGIGKKNSSKITLRVGEEKIIFKSVKPASSLIKRVYMLGLKERMELDLEARLMGETLLKRDQVNDLMPTIEEGEVIKEFRARNDTRMVSKVFGYPSDCDHDKKIHIDCAYNLKFSCMIVGRNAPQKSKLSYEETRTRGADRGHWKSKNRYLETKTCSSWRRQLGRRLYGGALAISRDDKRRRMPANVKNIMMGQVFSQGESRRCGHAEKATQKQVTRTIQGRQSKRQISRRQQQLPSVRGVAGGGTTVHPLTMTQRSLLATEGSKKNSKTTPSALRKATRRNGYCEYHRQTGHYYHECVQMRQLIGQIGQGGPKKVLDSPGEEHQGREDNKGRGAMEAKKMQPRDKADTIYMVQSWQRKTKQKVSQKFSQGSTISFPTLTTDNVVVEPLTIEINAAGHDIHRMYIDGGASADILYEHCFQRLRPEVKSQLNPATTSLTGFTGEKIWPMGQLRLPVIVGNKEHSTTAWMNFMVIRSPSPYNGIIGRPGISAIRAVPSTAHGMLKFPVDGGIVTIYNTAAPPKECNTVTGDVTQTKRQHATKVTNLKVAIHPDYPEQEVSIGGSLSDTGRAAVCALLQRNLDIFAWEPKHMTGVPRSITEHKLKIRQGYSPVRQKKRGQAPERAKAILEEVHKLVEAGIMREVYYHDWLSNPVMVKKSDGSWRMCVDFTDLNKACPQDCYPLPEIDWKVESLCGYPFKCFLDAYKGYHQIQMAKDDEENTAFHTSQGVYCYTKMPFGLNNAGATYQRLVDNAFEGQVGRNLEVYVDDLVIKSHTEDELVRNIVETFRALRKINMKLNPHRRHVPRILDRN